jgi:callose synthase
MAEGIRRSSLFKSDITLNQPLIGVTSIIIFIAAMVVLGRLFSVKERSLPYPVRRTIGIMLFTGLVAGIVLLFIEDQNYIRYALAGYYGVGAFCLLGLLSGVKFVKQFYLVHDIVCGHLIFIPLFLLAALQLPGLIQTWLLYHNALSADVVVSDILRYARKSQESGSGGEANEDLIEQLGELRRIVQKQEQLLAQAGFSTGEKTLSSSAGSLADLLMAPVHGSQKPKAPVAEQARFPGRAFSMSGLDVWGNMALGDVQTDELRHGAKSLAPSELAHSDNITVQTPHPQPFSFTQPDIMPPR